MSDAQSPYVDELKDFLESLKSVWGLLAGVTALFPLSGLVFTVVPIDPWPQGPMAYLSRGAISALCTLCCLFVTLSTFARRKQIEREARAKLLRRAGRTFLVSAAGMALYLGLAQAIMGNLYYGTLGLESDDLRRILGDLLLLALYCSFFAGLTRAFLLVALMELVRAPSRPREEAPAAPAERR